MIVSLRKRSEQTNFVHSPLNEIFSNIFYWCNILSNGLRLKDGLLHTCTEFLPRFAMSKEDTHFIKSESNKINIFNIYSK